MATATANHQSVVISLPATGTGLTLRIVSQPANGSVGLLNNVATYFPNPGFVGNDTFTFAAYDGQKNSNLSTVTIAVSQGLFSITAAAQVPASYPAGWPVAFSVVPSVTNTLAPLSFDWDFGDGTAHGNSQFPTHAYLTPGNYQWKVLANLSGTTATAMVYGTIVIGDPVTLAISRTGDSVTLSWPVTLADSLLETSSDLSAATPWSWVANPPSASGNMLSVTLPATGQQFFRLRRQW
jgi:PKD repeat protein